MTPHPTRPRCGTRPRTRSTVGTSSGSRSATPSSPPPSARSRVPPSGHGRASGRTRRCAPVPAEALALALAAAFLHAGWNVLLRGSADVAARTVAVLVLSVVLFAPAAAATWHVHAAALPYIAASSALEAVYF